MATPEHERLIAALKEHWLTDTDLGFLRELELEVLTRVHAEVQDHARRVHEGQRGLYEVMARATRFIPNFVLVKMSGSLSPYVLAQVTEHLEPKIAAALAKAFEPVRLAEISIHLDTRTAASIASLTDLDTLVQIVDSLARKGLDRRLGEISDALDAAMLEKLVHRIRDPERIAAVASHMQALDKLSQVARKLDHKLLGSVVTVLARAGHVRAARALTG